MTEPQPGCVYTLADVRRLREETGAGWLACKYALSVTSGNHGKAVEYLRVIRA